ncbi:hypothetical protein KY338_05840 [Candidatus Woesearchaeota archaeon]|nr:hypothetical protein [Candidatus Woesearchaeota archaeon]MBW3006279.1 hypothetical protein [Candidatus Woesearchaeota archaeon]
MNYVGAKYSLANGKSKGITNDHFEILKRATTEDIRYDGMLRKEHDAEAPSGWRVEEFWFENSGFTEACEDGRKKAEEESVVLLQAQPGLAERTVLWHPDNWQPEEE